jgi:hypothetical protein
MYLLNSAKNAATVNEVKDEIKGDGGIFFNHALVLINI